MTAAAAMTMLCSRLNATTTQRPPTRVANINRYLCCSGQRLYFIHDLSVFSRATLCKRGY